MRYPKLAALVEEAFYEDPGGPDAFRYALELYLRAIPNLGAAVDGFTYLSVIKETRRELQSVGISYVLPSSYLPVESFFKYVDGKVEYRILVGTNDKLWRGFSDSKRWRAVYLYATEGRQAAWSWGPVVEGTLVP